MPYAWMNTLQYAAGWGLGIARHADGRLPGPLDNPARIYALIGAWCWFVSGDVRRHLPLLRFSVSATLVFDVALIAIDVGAEMPTLWTAIEGPFVLSWTLLLWWLVRRVESNTARRSR